MHIHHNVPGILRAINDILADRGINIERQVLDTRGTMGYAIYDINRPCDAETDRSVAGSAAYDRGADRGMLAK